MTAKKPLPYLKSRQVEILLLLHRFRYLNRPQIQAMLGHKTWAKVIIWLNDLTDQHFTHRFYEPKLAGTPAVYCLDKASVRYLRELALHDAEEQTPPQQTKRSATPVSSQPPKAGKGTTTPTQSNQEPFHITDAQLKRIYREKSLSPTFREHCLFLADMYLSLQNDCKTFDSTLYFFSKTDIQDITYLPLPRPDAYFAITRPKGEKERYFLEVFDPLPPRMILRRRIWHYCNYYQEDYWQDNHPNTPFPHIILILPEDRSKRYVARQIKKIVENESLEDDITFFVGTWQEAREKGIDWEVLTEVKVR